MYSIAHIETVAATSLLDRLILTNNADKCYNVRESTNDAETFRMPLKVQLRDSWPYSASIPAGVWRNLASFPPPSPVSKFDGTNVSLHFRGH